MQRCTKNPIITRDDIPAISPALTDVTSVVNPGAVRIDGEYRLLLRVQTRGRETILMWARSEDGVSFRVDEQVVKVRGKEQIPGKLYHLYDPRLTVIEGELYAVFAADTESA